MPLMAKQGTVAPYRASKFALIERLRCNARMIRSDLILH